MLPKRYIDNREANKNLMDLLHYILYELNQYTISTNNSVHMTMTDSIGYQSSVGVEETLDTPLIEFSKNETKREM